MTANISEKELKEGARQFEKFWLRPRNLAGEEVTLQIELTKNWNGWKLKDKLVESIGLTIGDTINTEVKVLQGPGLIDETSDTDLFADGKGADWLLDNEIGYGSVINAKVRFVYEQAPVGGPDGDLVWKISLVFIEGYDIVREKSSEKVEQRHEAILKAIQQSLL